MLPALLAGRLGLEMLVEECVALGDRPGAENPDRKVMTMCSEMVLGADCIDDCVCFVGSDERRAGASRGGAVDAWHVPARVHVRHVRQLDKVLGRAWAAGAGPGDQRLVLSPAAPRPMSFT